MRAVSADAGSKREKMAMSRSISPNARPIASSRSPCVEPSADTETRVPMAGRPVVRREVIQIGAC